jgi:hypothetical protein
VLYINLEVNNMIYIWDRKNRERERGSEGIAVLVLEHAMAMLGLKSMRSRCRGRRSMSGTLVLRLVSVEDGELVEAAARCRGGSASRRFSASCGSDRD